MNEQTNEWSAYPRCLRLSVWLFVYVTWTDTTFLLFERQAMLQLRSTSWSSNTSRETKNILRWEKIKVLSFKSLWSEDEPNCSPQFDDNDTEEEEQGEKQGFDLCSVAMNVLSRCRRSSSNQLFDQRNSSILFDRLCWIFLLCDEERTIACSQISRLANDFFEHRISSRSKYQTVLHHSWELTSNKKVQWGLELVVLSLDTACLFVDGWVMTAHLPLSLSVFRVCWWSFWFCLDISVSLIDVALIRDERSFEHCSTFFSSVEQWNDNVELICFSSDALRQTTKAEGINPLLFLVKENEFERKQWCHRSHRNEEKWTMSVSTFTSQGSIEMFRSNRTFLLVNRQLKIEERFPLSNSIALMTYFPTVSPSRGMASLAIDCLFLSMGNQCTWAEKSFEERSQEVTVKSKNANLSISDQKTKDMLEPGFGFSAKGFVHRRSQLLSLMEPSRARRALSDALPISATEQSLTEKNAKNCWFHPVKAYSLDASRKDSPTDGAKRCLRWSQVEFDALYRTHSGSVRFGRSE